MIVYAALDDCIDFDRGQSGGDGRLNAGEHLLQRAEAAAQACEDLLVQRIQADGDAPQSIGVQIDCMIGQQHAVGGQCDVLDSRDAGQIANQIGQVGAQQGLAAGQAYFAHAQGGK